MFNSIPLTRDLVLVGGGHSHALVLRMWGMTPLPGARVTLIDPNPTAAYSGMLPGHIAGHYQRDELDIDLVRLARFAGARIILGAAQDIDLNSKTVSVADRPAIPFDVLSLDIGITSDMPDLPGFRDFAVPAKPLGPFAAAWSDFLDRLGERQTPPRIAVVGAGVAGVELVLAMAHRLQQRNVSNSLLTLIDAGHVLHTMPPRSRGKLLDALARHDIEMLENVTIEKLEAGRIVLSDGRAVAFDFCAGTAGARAHDWLAATGLDLTDGFVDVAPDLSAPNDAHVFAVGDCAHMIASPRPKAGVYAVRQAPVLFHNLRTSLSETGARRAYRPQDDYLKLISLGGQNALASKWGLSASGPALWRMKDRIDRKFMARLSDLPSMQHTPIPAQRAAGVAQEIAAKPPLCGGCGSKVSSASLLSALSPLKPSARADILTEPGDDAAVLNCGSRKQVITNDHLRAVSNDPWLMTRLAAIHALGDIWAMDAKPQVALASVTLPQASENIHKHMLAEISQAAADVFDEAGAALAGGHTAIGAEFTIGFTITGLADAPILQSGARDGDVLVLTKPLGSGTLLAGEMRGEARGQTIDGLYTEMLRSQASAADILSVDAHAMTDVTGFGLAGHLLSICTASGLSAELSPDAIPLYDGAEDLAAAGIRSSIWAANRSQAVPRIRGLVDSARHDLLFDPQTCGGLLAAVPEDAAEARLRQLKSEGYRATIIGALRSGKPGIDLH